MEFPLAFKEAMVRKMMEPGRKSTVELAAEVGVHKTTLSRWVREAGRLDGMSRKKVKRNRNGGRPNDRTPEEKLQLVLEASLLTDEEFGEFLREKGLHETQLEQWRKDAMSGLENGTTFNRRKLGPEARKIRDLENKLKKRDKELLRKDKALAEAAALIVLKKKADALWGDGEDDTE